MNKEIQIMRENESMDAWNDHKTYDRSFSCPEPGPEVLEYDKFPGEVHAYASRLASNSRDKDELT